MVINKKEKVEKKTIHRLGFIGIAKSVYLGGIIDECVLSIADGVGLVRALDLTNCLFVSGSQNLGKKVEDTCVGIPDLSLLNKVLGSVDESDVVYSIDGDGKWLKLRLKGRGQVRLLLIEPDSVATLVDSDDSEEKLVSNCNCTIKLSQKSCDAFFYFMYLFKSKGVVIGVEKGRVVVKSNERNENQFTVNFGKVDFDGKIRNEVYGEHLVSVLSVLDFSDDVEIPVMLLGMKVPVVVRQESFLWALSPIEDY